MNRVLLSWYFAPVWAVLFLFHAVIVIPLLVLNSILARLLGTRNKHSKPRLVWGSAPIMNFSYWARAMAEDGLTSVTYTDPPFSMHTRDDWDIIADERFPMFPGIIRSHLAFAESVWRFDVFFVPVGGFFLGFSGRWFAPNLLKNFHGLLLKLAGKAIVVLPFGGDSYVYRRIRSPFTLRGLQISYPGFSRKQRELSRTVDFWVSIADFFIPGFMALDGFGRCDVLTPSPLTVNIPRKTVFSRLEQLESLKGKLVVAHAPNHRGFKGTEFVLSAISNLQREGHPIELILIEGMPNRDVMSLLENEVDLVVDQLLFFGYGMFAIEAMAMGLPVIANLEDSEFAELLSDYTFFGECPVMSAKASTIEDVLRSIINDRSILSEVGRSSAEYVQKWHSPDAARFLFSSVISAIHGDSTRLKTLYHPKANLIPRHYKK